MVQGCVIRGWGPFHQYKVDRVICGVTFGGLWLLFLFFLLELFHFLLVTHALSLFFLLLHVLVAAFTIAHADDLVSLVHLFDKKTHLGTGNEVHILIVKVVPAGCVLKPIIAG